MPNPLVTQWLVAPGGLADRLRAIRVTAGLNQPELGVEVGKSKSWVSKVENGDRLPSADDIRAWVVACDAPMKTTDRLVRLRTEATAPSIRWSEKNAAGAGLVQATYGQLLSAASSIAWFELDVIPGILQTPAYAAAVLRLSLTQSGASLDGLDEAVLRRVESDRYLYDPEKSFEIVVAEPALRWWYGARETMAAQLDRLLGIIGLPNVEFGIVPLDVELVAVLPNAFVLYDDLAVVETAAAEHYYQGGPEVETYRAATKALLDLSARGDDARELILRAARR